MEHNRVKPTDKRKPHDNPWPTLLPPTNAPSPTEELAALVALVAKLASASAAAARAAAEANRLAAEVDAKLSLALGLANTSSITWIRAVAISPNALEATFPAGSGETWYVVIRGRNPGLYRTADDANTETNGVPNQYRQKKTSRREALAFYREHFDIAAAADLSGIPRPSLTLPPPP
ncbi:hypothetical protein C8R44DRAFT_896325 [Mycena epipterygia]|nr:hypothetical protein C8R44DRAFT_896325 [Mycena epipterygia]